MGQRHQIYFVLPREVYIQEEEGMDERNVLSKIVGFHHQWLYGQTALKQLNWFLDYYLQEDNDILKKYLEDACDTLKCVYSINPDGYYHRICELGLDAVKNPEYQDNNDGITIIDISEVDHPKYCFMLSVPGEIKSAREYVDAYYNEEWYKNQLMEAEESGSQEKAEDTKRWYATCHDLANEIDNKAKLLSSKEVCALFPSLFSKPTSEGEIE